MGFNSKRCSFQVMYALTSPMKFVPSVVEALQYEQTRTAQGNFFSDCLASPIYDIRAELDFPPPSPACFLRALVARTPSYTRVRSLWLIYSSSCCP